MIPMTSLRVLVLACLFALPASAAEPPLSRHTFDERHMGTLFRIIVWAKDDETARKASKEAFARVSELNAIMSDYLSTSELMRLCAKAGGEPVKVSGALFFVLSRAQKVACDSDGAFDVTVGPVVRLWRRARRTGQMPDAKKLAAARALVGYKNVVLDEKDQTVKLLKPGMLLDLGGIAKGYAADEALKVLAKHGLRRALVAAGGDIAVRDPPPGKPGWRIEIAAIDRDKEGKRYLELANSAVSTSGDAEQYVEIAGKRYSHIVDPRTGIGLAGRMSATVVAPNGITSDSLTKVVAVLGPKKGFEIIEKTPGVGGRFVRKTDKETEVCVSTNFPKLHGETKKGRDREERKSSTGVVSRCFCFSCLVSGVLQCFALPLLFLHSKSGDSLQP
jgi:thiamine biosynthesis lipoprotein